MDDSSGTVSNVMWRRIQEAERNAPADRPVLLVIEDNPNARILMRYALRTVVRTDAASTVTDALRMAEAVPYDGLLVDLHLPDGSGTEVVEELRDRTPYWGVPMVAVTGHSLPEGSGSFLAAGFDAYVAKPFEQDELRKLVYHLVVDSDEAVDKGRKLVQMETSQKTAQADGGERDESGRESPSTEEIDAPDS